MNIKLGNFFVVMCLVMLCVGGSVNSVEAQAGLTISSVTPQTVYNDLDTTITVTGEQFTDVIRAALNDTDLTELNIVDAQTLTAVIPWGMVPGTYTLNVYSELESASLESAITIELGIGEWISNGPYGGQVKQILQDPITTEKIFTVVAGVGVFRSVNHGENWEFIFATDMGTLAMDSVNPNLLYVTKTHEGLYRSVDGGDHWQAVPFPDVPQIYEARAYPHPTQGSIVFAGLFFSDDDYDAGVNFGIYKSTDAGTTWIHVSDDIPNEKKITSISFGTDAMYTGMDDGLIYRGTENGTSWVEMAVNWSGDPVNNIGKLKVQPVTNDLFVINGFSGPANRCTEVDNEGVISLDCAEVVVDTIHFFSSDPVSDIQFNPLNYEDILLAFSKPARSPDNGATWNVYSDFSAPLQSEAVMFDFSLPNTIFSSNTQGVFRNDSANLYDSGWTKKVEGMAGLIPNYLAVSASEPQSIYTNPSGAGFFHSSDGGVNWVQLPNFADDDLSQYTLNLPVAVDVSNDDYVIVPTWYNSVRVSLDGGLTWEETEEKVPVPESYSGYTFAFEFLEPIPGAPHKYLAGGYLMDPEDGDYSQAPAGAIFRLELDGTTATWTELAVEPSLGRVQAVVFDPADPTHIYCGSYTKDGEGYAEHSALVYSLDNGENWDILTPPTGGEFDGFEEISTVAMSPSTGVLLADGGSSILSIDPLTNTWDVYSYIPWNNGPINKLEFAPALGATPETLYAATMMGLFHSMDGGQSWAYVSSNFIGVNVTSLEYVALSEIQGIVYTGIVGSLVEAAGSGGGRSSEDLVDGGVYHLTRQYKEEILCYLPLVVK
ncbi:MAG TPA: hypothetical protein DF984_02040 [Anaerolineaceae bacterium]|jgi:photosystem II stability/assembly factor-like uncharacterized protein|nr:hypothetical protein [Anaerolineaceae bacterium]